MSHDERRIQMLIDRVPESSDAILDVGCLRHDSERRRRGNLHDRLCNRYPTASVVGVDLPGDELDTMKRMGYDVRGADCQTMDLGERFDAVVAGELIEHLPNPGHFIERAATHLRDGAPLILSTPNPNCLYYQAVAALGWWTSDDHTCWISPFQLETLCEYSDANVSVDSTKWVPWGDRWQWLPHKRLNAPNYVAVVR